MRRISFALAVLGLAAAAPLLARGDDREIARQIVTRLKEQKATGQLHGYDLDLKVEEGVVWLKGRVATPQQERLVLETARLTPGVTRVMKNIEVGEARGESRGAPAARSAPARPAEGNERSSSRRGASEESALQLLTGPARPQAINLAPPEAPSTPRIVAMSAPEPTAGRTVQAGAVQTSASSAEGGAGLQKAGPSQPQLMPVNPYYAYPYAGYYPAASQTPVAFAPAQTASAEVADAAGSAGAAGAAGMAGYGPAAPIHPVGAFGAAGVRYDHPHLPPYAWPTYAAYPNYAAVTYPKVYSPTVWPYIGPFYPYPQVPLGWRKVTLEWDDGWWQLDFKDQSRPWKMR